MNRSNTRTPFTLVLVAATGLSGCIETEESGNFLTDDTIQYTVSGSLTSSANLVVDSDINDALASSSSNDSMETAQTLLNLVTVQGFASASATAAAFSGAPDAEQFNETPDLQDYYSVNLLAGQSISLTVSNANNNSAEQYVGDLDLYLLDSEGDLVQSSVTTESVENVSVPEDGNYYIRVQASSGISKYVMQIFPATEISTARQSDFVTGEMLVGYDDTASTFSAQSIGAFSFQGTTQYQNRPNRVSIHTAATASLPTDEGDHHLKIQTLEAIKAMSAQTGVRYAEPNYIRYPLAQPNDPLFGNQWHYNQMSLPQAWDITTGSSIDGNDVIVAVIDTGVYLAHEDLANQLTAGYDFISNTTNASDGDGIDSDPDDPGDGFVLSASSWHGTHVAGTVAAETNNSLGGAGVSWNAKVMPIRVLGASGATSYDLAQGIYYAAGLSNSSGTLPDQPADIINMSLGGFSSTTTEEEAISQASSAGVVIVAAAGNESTSLSSYPAAYDGVISVSATDFEDNLASYSNFGSTIDIAAPGGDTGVDLNSDGLPDGIISTLVDLQGTTRTSGYQGYQGTSMAAPHVAGVIALMLAVNPDLTPGQIDELMEQGVLSDDLGSAGRDDLFGYGRINANKAVQAAIGVGDGSIVIPAILSATPSSLNVGTDDTIDFTISNVGLGTPNITSVQSSEDWASISVIDTDSQGLGSYRMTIDRTGLADGFYNTHITVAGTDEENSLSLSLLLMAYITVGDFTTTGSLTQQYLLAFDSSGAKINEVVVNSDGTYSISLPLGEYTLVAGSDTDVDAYICDGGETCGGYPSLNSLSDVTVRNNVSGIDFPVSIIGASSFSTGADSGTDSSTDTDNEANTGLSYKRSVSNAAASSDSTVEKDTASTAGKTLGTE